MKLLPVTRNHEKLCRSFRPRENVLPSRGARDPPVCTLCVYTAFRMIGRRFIQRRVKLQISEAKDSNTAQLRSALTEGPR